MPNSTYTIIIACEHSADSLRKTLIAISKLEKYGTVNVIVLDDGEDPDREKVIVENTVPGTNIRHIFAGDINRASAWNLGAREATTDLLFFLDDDCVPPPNWLNAFNRSFDAWNVGIVGGPDRVPDDASILLRSIDYVLTSMIGTLGARSGKIPGGKYYPRPWNMAARKESVILAGGFDEDGKQAPEIALIERMKRIGYGSAYQPDAIVGHYRETGVLNFVRRDLMLGMERGWKTSQPGMSRIYGIAILSMLALAGFTAHPYTHNTAMSIVTYAAYVYLVLLGISGLHSIIKTKNLLGLFLVPPLLALHHSAHILGYAIGYATRRLRRR